MKKTLIALMVFLSFASYAQKGSYRVWVNNGRVFMKENLSYKVSFDFPKEAFYKSVYAYDSTKILVGFISSTSYSLTTSQFLDSTGVVYGSTPILAMTAYDSRNLSKYATSGGATSVTVLNSIARVSNGTISSNITVGGTAQQIVATNANRTYLSIQNTGTTDLYFAIGSVASPTNGYKLPPGSSYEPRVLPTGYISLFGATTGQSFTYLQQ